MGTLLQDLRFGLRQLGRNPGFALIAILTLALAIGANTAIFTVANDFLFRPLPFSNSDRVVMVKCAQRRLAQSGQATEGGWADQPSFKYWRDHNQVFQAMAAWAGEGEQSNLTGPEGPERVRAKQVTEGFFRVLGVTPILGRTFSAAEDQPGGNRVAVISHALWQTRFGSDRDIPGKKLFLNGESYEVIGVLPTNFRFSTAPEDVWVPLQANLAVGAGGYYLHALGLLKPGVGLPQAQADMETLAAQLAKIFPQEWNSDQYVTVESLRYRYDKELRPSLLVLLGFAGLVLLIACANLANLLLARAAGRQQEIAIRRALGAGRWRIVRQMLIESGLLGLAGGAVGVLFATYGVEVLYVLLPSAWSPLTRGGIDAPVLLFSLAVSLLTVLLFGMAPALRASGFDLNETLKQGPREARSAAGAQSYRGVLVAGEVALAAILLTGAGLLAKSFVRISTVALGFQPESVLAVALHRTGQHMEHFYDPLLQRISALPQVRAAGIINFAPLTGGGWGQDITIGGRPPRARGDLIWAAHRQATPGYFRAMGIPLLRGRAFEESDWWSDNAIISEAMAKQYWPGEDPIGKHFGVNCADSPCLWRTVVGVVGDVKELGPAAEPAIAMYFMEIGKEMTLAVRATEDPTRLVADIRQIVHSLDPNQPIGDVRTMQSMAAESVAPQRLTMLVSMLFAALALVLAMVGLYGVISYSVAQRTHEFGVRMALGAERSDILKLVVGQGSRLILMGVGMGILGALALTRFVSSLLYGVKPTDPLTFLGVTLLLIAVALLASYIPARRATKVDPLVALRYE
ncbi:MAG: ABC transporter permease [Terriglobia bacterium]|jgi:putative ABC transport system permease protein